MSSEAFFQGAHNFILNGKIHIGPKDYHTYIHKAAVEKLREHIAAGAMHDSAERSGAPKCHPETRVAVQKEIINWIVHGDEEEEPKKILWVTGPAGVGKTAITGSVADSCYQDGLLACGFFFSMFTNSENRRTKRSLIATLAYQLVQHKSLQGVGERILSSIDQNPAIFERQLDVQLEQLVFQPLREARRDADISTWPKVIVIDGLDECEAEQFGDIARFPQIPARSKEDDQTEILSTLLKAANEPHFPFRIVVSSRSEPAIESFFSNTASHLTRKIFLDGKYNPDADMTLFIEYKFAEIRRRDQLPALWPPEGVKRTLVQKASGQFIYVATVMRFIEASSASPLQLLDQVLRLNITNASTNPFAELDALYTHILTSCPDPSLTTRWLHIIFCTRLLRTFRDRPRPASFVRIFLESSPGEASRVLRGLNSLVSIPPADDETLPFSLFHKSLVDFLRDKARYCNSPVDYSDIEELYVRRYLQIWKEVSQPSSPLKDSDFFRKFVELDFEPVFQRVLPDVERTLLDCNIAWWVRSQDELLRDAIRTKGSENAYKVNISFLFHDAHRSCRWYRRCRPLCTYIRTEMLKELQKLGWKIPSRLHMLRHRFFHFDLKRTGISPPPKTRARPSENNYGSDS